MDARHFDAQARVCSSGNSRRRLLALLVTLPLLGDLLGWLDPEGSVARDRRRSRKGRHKHSEPAGENLVLLNRRTSRQLSEAAARSAAAQSSWQAIGPDLTTRFFACGLGMTWKGGA